MYTRFTPATAAALRVLSVEDQRPVAALIAILVEEALKRRAALKEQRA